jgi:hypothetical protein
MAVARREKKDKSKKAVDTEVHKQAKQNRKKDEVKLATKSDCHHHPQPPPPQDKPPDPPPSP